MENKITIIIPSWNGKSILAKSLPEVIKYSGKCKIIVIDDGSIDDTVDYLKNSYPRIEVIRNDKNLGFTKSMNVGLKRVKTPFVVFLNNDVYPTSGYLNRPVEILERDEEVSAVNFCEVNSSWPDSSFLNGKLSFKNAVDKEREYCVLWPSGGSSVLRVSHLNELGNYNEIYSPGYWEDIDLGWRLWKNGKKVIWTNKAVVIHEHETSFSKLDPNFISTIKQRNELLWHWLNISDSKLLRSHLMFLLRYTLLHPGYIKIILSAVFKFSTSIRSRNDVISDTEVFERINHEYKR